MGFPDYYAPPTLEAALARLQSERDRARVIAGGTDVLPGLRRGALRPALLIDLASIPLDGIRIDQAQVALGARVTFTRILETGALTALFPALVEACGQIGGPPVRNRGTLGGNLVNASPAADTAIPLLVYDATLVLDRLGSRRQIPLERFFLGPGQTVIAPDELLTEVRIPRSPSGTASLFVKLGKRRAMAVAVASVAVRLTLSAGGRVSAARIALGSVAPRPIRAYAAEALLTGYPLAEERIAQVAREAAGQTAPVTDLRASAAYRKRMAEVLTRRALTTAWQQLKGLIPHG